MQISIATRLPGTIDNACQLVFVYADGKLKGAGRKIDAESDGIIKALFASGDFTGKCGQTLMLHGLAGTSSSRVLLTGLGERKKAGPQNWRQACAAACRELLASPATLAISDCLSAVDITELTASSMGERLATELICAGYVFDLHGRQEAPRQPVLEQLVLKIDRKQIDQVSQAADRGLAVGHGMSTARDLGNLAPNMCTPTYLANRAELLANEYANLSTTIIDEDAMEELGMGAFLAVSRGSRQPGKLIIMEYRGQKRAGKPLVLVGKGVTFDTGGISIKPSESMDEMKYDMCGAASVFGAVHAVARLQLPVDVIGIVAAAENMPDGDAARPGDVITSMSGQTIEILNTDAEGRLVLCDALTYASRFKPNMVVDMATLTGACITALGRVASGVMGNDQAVVDALLKAGESTGDRCWSLPIWEDYQTQLDSNFADMANIGGRPAGAITAACFLSRFAADYRWAHLDIAGTAWLSGKEKGATGRPVPLLMQLIFDQLG